MSRKISMILRLVLGLIFIIFGANKYGHFLPDFQVEGEAAQFLGALTNAGYWKILGVFEIFIGLLLLTNKWIGFALVIAAALATNFLIFHIQYDLAGSPPALLVSALTSALIYGNWGRFKALL